MIALKPLLLIAMVLFSLRNVATAQEKTKLWQDLRPYFSVPAKYADSFGTYRDPLKFYNGEAVRKAGEWPKRRNEILERWRDMLGHWPALIENPEVEILDSVRRDNFTQFRIRFEWRVGERTTAYLLVPDGPGKKPAVITVYYEPETAIGTDTSHIDFALQLAKRGFVALSVGTDAFFYGKQSFDQYYPSPDSVSIQPLYMLAYLAANSWNLLSNWKDVDSSRIGIMGHSYGSKWAMFASCFYEKFACAVWCDGGIVFDESRGNVNYWDPWYLGYYPPPWQKEINASHSKGVYPRLVSQGYDLHELHALMAPRPFLVSGGSEDPPERWIPLNHSVAVNKLLGYKNRVGMTNRSEHRPDSISNRTIYGFFEYFLK